MADLDYDDYQTCDHICDDDCYGDDFEDASCTHQHCPNCGECGCPGYCDDFQTYNLRPAETGGSQSYPGSGDDA